MPDDTANNYTVGDRVRVISYTEDAGTGNFPVGTVGTISVKTDTYYIVETDTAFWAYADHELEPAE